MKRAKVVIGAAFGDEGKGLMTDYHVRQGDAADTIVVRFNGGANAGHTVVTPEGQRHVFRHFGSGTLAGARTFLSRDFLVNPVLWRMEMQDLQQFPKLRTRLFVDREAPLTTVYDMLQNQHNEKLRGKHRHGSCGAGVHQTMVRQETSEFRIFAGDLERPSFLRDRIYSIRKHCCTIIDAMSDEAIFERFLADCSEMAKHISIRDSRFLSDQRNVVFEGAQGLLLDAENKQFFPHVTHSRTGLTNVLPLAHDAGLDGLDVTYVVRSYLTRHGAGPLLGEDPSLSYEDNTNTPNEWQGKLRFAPFDVDMVRDAIDDDLSNVPNEIDFGVEVGLAITHCDQLSGYSILDKFPWPIDYVSTGPTHKDVRARKR